MRAGQSSAMLMRLRLGDHVVRHDLDVFGSTTPRSGSGGGSDYAFAGRDLRDVLTHAPLPDDTCQFVLRPCMRDVIDWIYSNGLTWFLATHNTERSMRNAFTRLPVVPSQYVLVAHWYPESFARATIAKSLHKFWITRVMPVPTDDTGVLDRMYATIFQAMSAGALQCTLLLLHRGADFSDCSFADDETRAGTCIEPRRVPDFKPLVEQHILIAYYVNMVRHGALIQWLTQEQGLGWCLALPAADSDWAYFVATWERVGVPEDDQ